VRGLRNFSQAVRSNQVSARATSRVREPGDHEVEAERPELKRCRVDTSEQHAPGAEAKRKVDSAKKEESSSGHFSEESEEEVIEETVAPLGGKGHRRPPEPDGPPPKQKKDGNGRKERHRHQAGNTSSCKGSKPRHRAGRKHQRLGRLEFDPTVKVHRKLSGHFLDTLATDAGKDSFKQAAMSGRPHSEGEEFNLHDLEQWCLISPLKGDVLFVDLRSSDYAVDGESWAPFLVMDTTLLKPLGTLSIEAKFLGGCSAEHAVPRRGGCLEEEAGALHVTRFVWHTLHGAGGWLTGRAIRSASAWLQGDRGGSHAIDVEEEVEELPKAGVDTTGRGGAEEAPARPGALRRSKKEPLETTDPGSKEAKGSGELNKTVQPFKKSAAKPKAPRGAATPASSKVTGKGVGGGPGNKTALDPAKVQRLRAELKKSRQKLAAGGPPDPSPEGDDDESGGDSEPGSSGSAESEESPSAVAPTALTAGTLMGAKAHQGTVKAIKDGTTGDYHKQLIQRAAGTAELGSGSSSEESPSTDEDAELEAPLRRRSQKHPGSVLNLLLEHIANQLQQSAEVDTPATARGDLTTGVKVVSYLALAIRPHFGHRPKELREMHNLATSIDLLRQGQLARLGDVLAGRLIAIHQSLLDASWASARHLEVMPMPEGTALSDGVLLAARKHGRQVSRAQDPSLGWRPPKGKGKGKRNQEWGHYENEQEGTWWQPKGKGKSQKKGKSKKDKEKEAGEKPAEK
ncbi:Uncharacterized protein SCF082_LOCUS24827, partial [Durusdinium trenchii]